MPTKDRALGCAVWPPSVQAGAEVVVAGCTEVSLLLISEDVSVPLVDSAGILAWVCVDKCR